MINNIEKNIELYDFEKAFELVGDMVDRALSTSPLIIRNYTEHLKQVRGKFIRTASLLTVAMNDEGLIHSDAVCFATAIELLHLGTLVHDDVIDNAKTRRGIATLQKKFGKKTAVITGDYIYCLALNMVGKVSDRKKYIDFGLPDYMGKICLGELNQHINNNNFSLSELHYFKIISGKTAALFEASLFAGGLVNGCDKKQLNKYTHLGRYLGMIFQLTDDCIDFEVPSEIAKKPVQSDFEQGVITLPLIYAFKKDRALKQKALDGTLSRSEINKSVSGNGGTLYTKAVSKKYFDKSIKIINSLEAQDEKKDRLVQIFNKAYTGLKTK